MTDKTKKLEGVKQEIRSVLLTQPNGSTIPGLLSDYRSIVGQHLPFREFGCPTPDDFLRSIPDVVSMHWSQRYNAYVLKAVADATTKHIEKLVSKQKTGKSSALSRRIGTGVPPRFNRTSSSKSNIRAYLPSSVKNEIFQVVKEFKNGLSLPNFMTAFRQAYGKELVLRNYGFYTLEDCLLTIEEVFLRNESGELRVYPVLERQAPRNTTNIYSDSWKAVQVSSGSQSKNKENQLLTNDAVIENAPHMSACNGQREKKTMDVLDNFTYPDDHSDSYGISPALREKFKQIMKKSPQGIWVSQFPDALLKYTGYQLDHRKLGYYNLVDLFSDLPEIFRIEVFDGCKDDWKLFDATDHGESSKLEKGLPSVLKATEDCLQVVRNVRLLLQANPEGVCFDDFCELYEANCGEQLSLNALHFDSLPVFLEAIKEQVPLTVDCSVGKKPRVHYKKEGSSKSMLNNKNPLLELSSGIPPDAVFETEYEVQKIPEDSKSDQFFAVYISAAVDPSHIYVRLRETLVLLESLMDELEYFYYRAESKQYKIPENRIMSGIVCAAVWPSDGRWHRIRVSSVPSSSSVVAFFIDYGTKERIPSDNLRYLKKKFMKLPAQAIRSHLCKLKPSIGDSWDPRARDQILDFGRNPLMACLAEKMVGDESLPLVLCDVSGKNDIFLNDLLVSEGYARYETDEQNLISQEVITDKSSDLKPGELISPVKSPEVMPVHQQASVSSGNVPGNLLQLLALLNASSLKICNSQNLSSQIPDLLNSLSNGDPSSIHPLVMKQLEALGINGNVLGKTAISSPTQPAARNLPDFSPSSIGVPDQGALADPQQIYESDSEVFESDEEIDDDDSPEVNSISKRYVKRIHLDDGYEHVHMIVIDGKPYMSSGDITFLLWSHDDPNFVRRKLKSKEIYISNNTLNEIGYEQLFYQLGRFQVKGVKTDVNGNNHITLFPFKNVIDILNIFGHPSVAVRDIIDDELLHFDPSDSFWKTITEEEFEEVPGSPEATCDKDKKENLYELKASLQALKFRKQTLKNQLYSSVSIPSLGDEIERIETQCSEVERRIRELQVKVVSHQRERRFD